MGFFDKIMKMIKWEPLKCRPQDIIDVMEECIRIDAPVMETSFDYDGKAHMVGISSYTESVAAPYTDIRYFLDDSEFETIDEFKKGATINGRRFMDLEYIAVTKDLHAGNPRYIPILAEREIKD